MTVATIAQDRTVKLPISDAAAVVDGTGANDDGQNATFGDLLAQLASDDAASHDEATNTEIADDVDAGVPIAGETAPSPATLQALLANAVSSIVQDVKADVKAGATAVQSSSNDIAALARAIADNAKLQGDTLAVPTESVVKAMPSSAASLETWSNGPHAVAAPTTGAQDKRPMDLAVVGVATHFAPVLEQKPDAIAVPKGGAVAQPDTMMQDKSTAGAKADGGVSIASAVTAPANQTAGATGFNFEGGADRRGAEGKAEVDVKTELRADASLDAIAKSDFPTNSPQTQQTPVVKQIAGEVMRAAEVRHTNPLHLADSKPALSKLKVLHIQLQPDSLGSVTVRMQLRADLLELHIDASRPETADLIQRDREVLSSILRAAGYTADDAQIKVTHADPSIVASLSSNSDTSASSQQSGSQMMQDRAAQQERDGGRRDRGEERREIPSREDIPHSRSSEATGVYL